MSDRPALSEENYETEMAEWSTLFLDALASGDPNCYISDSDPDGVAVIDGRFDLRRVRASLESRGCDFSNFTKLVSGGGVNPD